MPALTSEERDLLQRIRALPSEQRRALWNADRAELPLTARELEVLALVAEGLTNEVIAARLSIALETVKSHLRNLTAKLGARNRAHLVARGFMAGLL